MSKMDIKEKVAFIKGLMEGMKFKPETNEGIILEKVVDALGDIASELSSLSELTDKHDEYLDELDHDLGDLEEYVYEDDDCCDCCGDEDDYDDDDYDDDDDLYEVECPHCHDKIYIDAEAYDEDKVICPNCGKTALDFTADDLLPDEEIDIVEEAPKEEKKPAKKSTKTTAKKTEKK